MSLLLKGKGPVLSPWPYGGALVRIVDLLLGAPVFSMHLLLASWEFCRIFCVSSLPLTGCWLFMAVVDEDAFTALPILSQR